MRLGRDLTPNVLQCLPHEGTFELVEGCIDQKTRGMRHTRERGGDCGRHRNKVGMHMTDMVQ